jgi:hypothetical protein
MELLAVHGAVRLDQDASLLSVTHVFRERSGLFRCWCVTGGALVFFRFHCVFGTDGFDHSALHDRLTGRVHHVFGFLGGSDPALSLGPNKLGRPDLGGFCRTFAPDSGCGIRHHSRGFLELGRCQPGCPSQGLRPSLGMSRLRRPLLAMGASEWLT